MGGGSSRDSKETETASMQPSRKNFKTTRICLDVKREISKRATNSLECIFIDVHRENLRIFSG